MADCRSDHQAPDRHAWYREQGWWTGESLVERYAGIARARPDALAVIGDDGRSLTHAGLWRAAGDLAADLGRRAIGRGDIVLVFMQNRIEWQVALLAILRAGAIPANLPVRTDADTLAYVIDLCGARAVVASREHGTTPVGVIAHSAARQARHAVDVCLADAGGAFAWPVPPAPAGARPDAAVPAPRDLDHVMFTSSTTGRPKAVMHSADTLAALNVTFIERFALDAERPIFMASPLGHSVGAIHGARLCLYGGAPLVLQDRWDPGRALDLIDRHRCQFTAAATPFFKDLLDAPWRGDAPKLAPMRSFLCGGAQVPASLMVRARAEFPHTFTTVLWGMTEGGLTTCLPDSPRDKVRDTAGTGLPGLEYRALDAAGRAVDAGEEGELVMRGPGVFIGYLGQADLYASLLTSDGFFRTGDLARIDETGYVRITGRLKDLIVRGGVNISPVPTEDALAAHPAVRSVAVIGYPDERLGERLCAVLVLAGDGGPGTDDPALSVAALRSFLTGRGLPKYLCPELVRFVDTMPRTAAGKIRKLDLRASVLSTG